MAKDTDYPPPKKTDKDIKNGDIDPRTHRRLLRFLNVEARGILEARNRIGPLYGFVHLDQLREIGLRDKHEHQFQ